MLILTQRREAILSIDDGRILVKVVSIEGSRVKLGVVAPKEVRVERLPERRAA